MNNTIVEGNHLGTSRSYVRSCMQPQQEEQAPGVDKEDHDTYSSQICRKRGAAGHLGGQMQERTSSHRPLG